MAAIAKLKLLSSRRATDVPTVAAPIAAAADEDDLPIPSDIKTVLLGGLFLLAMLGACYVASEIILPIVLAFVLSLLLQPAMAGARTSRFTALDRRCVPHSRIVRHARRVRGGVIGTRG